MSQTIDLSVKQLTWQNNTVQCLSTRNRVNISKSSAKKQINQDASIKKHSTQLRNLNSYFTNSKLNYVGR